MCDSGVSRMPGWIAGATEAISRHFTPSHFYAFRLVFFSSSPPLFKRTKKRRSAFVCPLLAGFDSAIHDDCDTQKLSHVETKGRPTTTHLHVYPPPQCEWCHTHHRHLVYLHIRSMYLDVYVVYCVCDTMGSIRPSCMGEGFNFLHH